MIERLVGIVAIILVIAWGMFLGSAFAVGLWYYSTAMAELRAALGL